MTASASTLAPAWIGVPEVKRLFQALGAPAVDVRCVGGSVRDAVIGRDRIDAEIDVGTPESPTRVMERLSAAGLRVIPTGLDHGTVTAVVDGRSFEITSLRRDTACDGRHAAVEFTTDWREDARRRDFTMNAMSMTLDGVLHDYHDGAADARAGRVRFVGAPDDRIQEDYLRILRLFRFTALYGQGDIDPTTLAACARHKTGLTRLSAERIHDEMAKLLAASDPTPTVKQMQACGVLVIVLSDVSDVEGLARLIVAEGSVARDCPANVVPGAWVRRLAVMISATDVSVIAARLKLSHEERIRLERAVADPPLTPAQPDLTLRQALFHQGAATVVDRLLVSWASQSAPQDVAAWRALIARVCAWVHPPLPVRGADVMALGIPAGPDVGRSLAAMTAWWIEGAFTATRDQALTELARLVAALPPKR